MISDSVCLGVSVRLGDGRSGRVLAFSPSRTRVLLTGGIVCALDEIVAAKWI